MPRTTEPDPALVQRIRDLLGRPGARGSAGRVGWGPGWVPGPPTEPPPSGTSLTAGESQPPGSLPPGKPSSPRVVTMPSFLRGARVRVGRRALAAMTVLVASAAGVFVMRVSVAMHQGEPVAVAAIGSGLVGRSVPPGFTAIAPASSGAGLSTSAQSQNGAASSSGGAGPPTVLVHVVGEVASPGVVTLGVGSRVADAVARAGGALPAADLERVNLARIVADGEQVHVPAPGEPLLPGSGGAAAPSGPAGAGSSGIESPPVNLNTADVAALDTLPGVGPVLAQRIVQWRQEHGPFASVQELNEVSGIGDKLFAQLRTRVIV